MLKLTSFVNSIYLAISVIKLNSSRKCCNYYLNSFGYICREYGIENHKRNITDFLKMTYKSYFELRLGDLGKSWEPYITCKTSIVTVVVGQTANLNSCLLYQWFGENQKYDVNDE